MTRIVVIVAALLVTACVILAASPTIFNGGSADGYDRVQSAVPLIMNDRFKGGTNDGFDRIAGNDLAFSKEGMKFTFF